MRKYAEFLRVLTGTLVVAGVFTSGVWTPYASAQERPGAKETGAEQKLTEPQRRGEGLFLQRCSLCHLPRKLKFGSPPVVGPSLEGVFKNQAPDDERKLRDFVMKGSLHMPGVQYALSPKEMDDLFAYLKTM